MDHSRVEYDYIIAGGGLSGCVVASRLREYLGAESKILVVEAGEDTRSRTDILQPQVLNLGSELDWMYQTEPQTGLGNRSVPFNAGKGLGGGSLINSGGWTRGSAADYDEWASAVGDQRWSYAGQLPWMKKTEEWFDDRNSEQHGRKGPIYVASSASSGRKFPLSAAVASGWDEMGDVPELPDQDQNAGNNIGRAQICEGRRNGQRQFSAKEYPLEGISILTDSLIKKVIVEPTSGSDTLAKATGIELADGRQVRSKNVIVSAGAFRTPQILMLSGVGPSAHLKEHGIETIVDSPEVGQGLTDHMSFYQFWRLKDSSPGYTLGSANALFQQPEFARGVPMDWIVCADVPHEGLAAALKKDAGTDAGVDASTHPYLKQPRAQVETVLFYMKLPIPGIAMDADHLTTITIPFLPTSRGTVTLRSTNPADRPVVDPNYLATETDRHVFRAALRRLASFMRDTGFGGEYIAGESEVPPVPGLEAITPETGDAEIDARVKVAGTTTWHASGSCSMGKVVDSELRVKGVEGLRIVDASVLPVPLSAHLQAPLYVLAEQAAGIIAGVGSA